MSYFNYHACIRKLLSEGKLKRYCFVNNHNGIRPALVLYFEDEKHPVMAVRKERWHEYTAILPSEKQE